MAAAPAVSPTPETRVGRWSAHRGRALAVRAVVYLTPVVASIVFVHYAGQIVPAPLSSLWLYLAWWFGLSVAATGVLVAIDRITRRLLPLAALLQLSLVFPDEAPSRFKIAFRAGDVDRLEARLAAKEAVAAAATPAEAANRLLELVAALNIHDPLTRGHCDRVRAYSVLIGEELGLKPEELDLLNWAALLHDVGKLDVPTEILSKDGKPTDEEWQVLRLHPIYGEELVEAMADWLGPWTSAVGFHHERWDGKGYPRGLAGEEIPLPGRIVAVADVFDVITSVRSYKKASAAEEGRAEIARCAGTQFDADVVRAFLNVSLGRMRLVMGPLSWLAHAPMLGRLPFTPALGTAAGALSVAATSAVAGIVPTPPAATAAVRAATAPAAVAAPAARGATRRATPQAAHRVVLRRRPVAGAVHASTAARRPAPAAVPTATAAPAVADPPAAPAAEAPAPAPTTEPAPVPPAPRFSGGGDVSVAEDSPAASLAWASTSDDDVTYATSAFTPDLFSVQPSISPAGVLSFTPAKDANGSTTVVATAGNANGLSDPRSFRVTVTPVDDPPSFTGAGDVTAVEGGGATTIAWASQISPGPPNEARQHVTFEAVAKDESLFAPGGLPVVDERGNLSFTPAAFANGRTRVQVTAIDDGGTANGGVDRTTATFALTILPRNHGPVIAGIGDVRALEDSGPQAIQWITSTSPGAPDESTQSVQLSTTNDHPELFSAQPALSQSGVLTFTPAADASGTATVEVTARDDGGTANDGVDTTTLKFTITVKPVDDAPSFTGGGNVSTREDAAATLLWASAISPGPANESAQHVTFDVTNDRNALFLVQPTLNAAGKLSYKPAPDANGTATVTVVAHDDGGTANGGVDTSAPVSFTLTIEPVNDAPSFSSAGNVTSLEDTTVTASPWASAISPGPSNESSQNVSLSVVNDSNPSLFSSAPSFDAAGRLSYTPAPDANGSATITVVAQDDGGTSNGGTDTSQPVTFTITVAPVNDAPSVAPIAGQTVDEESGPQTAAVTSFGAGPANESAQTLTVSTSVDHPEYFEAGAVPTIDAAGNLTYTPAAGAFGTATITVTVADDGGTANGGIDQASTTFTITIVELPPVAADDAYATTIGSTLSVNAASGVLANDGDVNSSTLTATPQTTTSGLLGGTFSLAADGSFTYSPGLLSGQDTFAYTVTDGNGQTDTGTVTFTVTLLAPASGTLYLQTSGLSAEVWSLGPSAPAAASPVPDLDGDGAPGLTLESSDGKSTNNDPKKQQAWAYETGATPLSLSGPLTLNLWAASKNLDADRAETLSVYVYDCPAGSSSLSTTGCTLIGQNQMLVAKWSTTPGYETHSVVVPMNAVVGAGRQLRVRLLVGQRPLWIPLVGPYTSSVDYSG
jgi:HD-GYP domain-containing protein (c-di-GMP phosphodiesterase class II)